LEQDDRVEDFRAMFRDADTDYSGYLSADEVYTVLLKNGIDLSFDELCELINEFDVSGDAQLDIDEFVAMMNTSSDMSFHS
jgi:Ca2+-binding EF-hand superfamily protein